MNLCPWAVTFTVLLITTPPPPRPVLPTSILGDIEMVEGSVGEYFCLPEGDQALVKPHPIRLL